MDAVLGRGGVGAAAAALGRQQVAGGGLAACGLAVLETLEDLLRDDLRRDLGRAEGDVEVVGLLEAHLADHVGEDRRAHELLRREALAPEVLLEQLATRVLGVLARLGAEPLLDLVAGARRLDQGQPVPGGAALALGGEHLDDVPGLQLVVQRDDLVVHLRPHAAVADVGVDLIGEVERRGAGG